MMTATTVEGELLAAKIERCQIAQRSWAQQPIRTRLQPIGELRRLLTQEHADLCDVLRGELGRPVEETLAAEVIPLADACEFLQKRTPTLLKPRLVPRWPFPPWYWLERDEVHRRPRGVVGIIGTWNFPLFLNGVQIAQALAAGNGVVWKPSEAAPAAADALWGLLQRAGFPRDLLQRLPATREAGPQLVEADVDHIVFTGHSTTGRKLASQLGERLISSTLELSGHDALFLLEDGDTNLAARAAWFATTANAGQTCLATRRVFVPRDRLGVLLAVLRPLVEASPAVRLALPAQADAAERIIHDAVAAGAECIRRRASPRLPDLFQPALLVHPPVQLFTEALFAPVLAVFPYSDLSEALAADAQCGYGLGAAIFTRRTDRARALAAQLRTGVVYVNDVLAPTAHPATPLAGRGNSGWGATQGVEGLLEMTAPQTVSFVSGSWRPHYDWRSSRLGQRRALEALLRWRHGRTVWQRMLAGWRLLWSLLQPVRDSTFSQGGEWTSTGKGEA